MGFSSAFVTFFASLPICIGTGSESNQTCLSADRERSLFANRSAGKKMAGRCLRRVLFSSMGLMLEVSWRVLFDFCRREALSCFGRRQPSSNKGPIMGWAGVVL